MALAMEMTPYLQVSRVPAIIRALCIVLGHLIAGEGQLLDHNTLR